MHNDPKVSLNFSANSWTGEVFHWTGPGRPWNALQRQSPDLSQNHKQTHCTVYTVTHFSHNLPACCCPSVNDEDAVIA